MKNQLNLGAGLALFFCCLFSISLTAQKDYKWEKDYEVVSQIPEALLGEDAIIISDYEERQSRVVDYQPFSRIIHKRRYKVLTQKGLEETSRIYINRSRDLGITILDARTFKKNGEVVDLQSSDIKTLEYNDDLDLVDKEDYRIMAVPGLEVGDEFEIVVIYEGSYIGSGGNVFLHHELPTLKSNFSLFVDSRIAVFVSRYNEMPKPKITETLDNYRYEWTLENLPGLYDKRGTIPGRSLPYFIYEFNFNYFEGKLPKPPVDDWRELIISLDKNSLGVVIRNKKEWEEQFNKVIGDKTDLSNIKKMQVVHDYFNENLKLVKLEDNEKSQGVEHFFEEQRADFATKLMLYKAVFEKLEMPYFLVTGRAKEMGNLQLNFPTTMQITDYFFMAYDEADNIHLFFPKQGENSWPMDEIPSWLRGTTVYMLNMVDKETFKQIDLPYASAKDSRLMSRAQTTIDLNTKMTNYKCVDTYTGAFSARNRADMYDLQKEGELVEKVTEVVQKDMPAAKLSEIKLTEYPTKPPFKYSLEYQIDAPDQISELEEGVYVIKLDNWLDFDALKAGKNKRLLDYYPDFAYQNTYNVVFGFEDFMELQNKENIDVKVENEVGVFELTVNQLNPLSVGIRAKYIINVEKIPADKMHLLNELYEAAEQAGQEGIIVTKK